MEGYTFKKREGVFESEFKRKRRRNTIVLEQLYTLAELNVRREERQHSISRLFNHKNFVRLFEITFEITIHSRVHTAIDLVQKGTSGNII